MTTINIKIDEIVKREFSEICKSRGITVSGALKLYIYAEVAKAKENKPKE